MAFSINQFYSELSLGGARPSMFEVRITNPVNGGADQKVPFMCKAASIPAAEMTPVVQNYFGRPLKFAGNRTYADWTVTIINDEDFAVRKTLEIWNEALNGYEDNLRDAQLGSPNSYKADAEVIHYGKRGDIIRTYKLVGLFPTVIDAISLSWDDADTIEEYGVTFAYDYWVTDGVSGNLGDIVSSLGRQAISSAASELRKKATSFLT